LKRIVTLFWPAFLVLLLDQITKLSIRLSLAPGESIPVLGPDFFLLTHVRNTGVAFGLQPGGIVFLALFNAAASLGLIYLLLRSSRQTTAESPRLVQFALALILGGALGNLIDRVAFGRVTDFLDFDFPNFIMTRWPVFNIADSAVLIGVTLWSFYLLFAPQRKPREDASQA